MRARAWAGVLARGQQYAISGASSTACLMQQSTTPVKHSTTQSPRLPTHRHTMKTFLLRPHDAAARSNKLHVCVGASEPLPGCGGAPQHEESPSGTQPHPLPSYAQSGAAQLTLVHAAT
ncbi:hypothetical protein E2C01_016298 [Portunus trituberculatus]|uniref:Uncharacterized protein n=1 Tax=Portunus trituberculatus TaxID=210409 RepID=A0A5B7DP69_PORTR|nr:hypothetical protein [Portunus trituberculatus]